MSARCSTSSGRCRTRRERATASSACTPPLSRTSTPQPLPGSVHAARSSSTATGSTTPSAQTSSSRWSTATSASGSSTRAHFGMYPGDPAGLAGGSPEENAASVRSLFAGEAGVRRDAVLLNAAAALVAAGLAEGPRRGRRSCRGGDRHWCRGRPVFQRGFDLRARRRLAQDLRFILDESGAGKRHDRAGGRPRGWAGSRKMEHPLAVGPLTLHRIHAWRDGNEFDGYRLPRAVDHPFRSSCDLHAGHIFANDRADDEHGVLDRLCLGIAARSNRKADFEAEHRASHRGRRRCGQDRENREESVWLSLATPRREGPPLR